MTRTRVTFRNIVETARQCRGSVSISDAGKREGLYIQVDAEKSKYDNDARAYIGDTIVEFKDSFAIVRNDVAIAV